MFKRFERFFINQTIKINRIRNKGKIRILWSMAGSPNAFYDVFDLSVLYLKMRILNISFYLMFFSLIMLSSFVLIAGSKANEESPKMGSNKHFVENKDSKLVLFIVIISALGMGGSFYLYRERAKDYEGLALVSLGTGNTEDYISSLISLLKITRKTLESKQSKVSKTDLDDINAIIIQSLKYLNIEKIDILYDVSEHIKLGVIENKRFPLELQNESGTFVKVDLIEKYNKCAKLYVELETEYLELRKHI